MTTIIRSPSALLISLLLLAAQAVQAQFDYSTNGDTITLTGYSGSGGAVTISNFVTGLGEDAFRACTSLTSVTIPESVTNIGEYAFYECPHLTSVTIGCSVVGDTFQSFALLTNVTIANSATSIGSNAFKLCTGLTSVTIGDSVTNIGANAFEDCTRLANLTIGDSVTSIGEDSFVGCISLTNLTIPESVTNIGVNAFDDCTGLTNLTIPDSVTSIGEDAFYACQRLTNVTIGDSVSSIGDYAFLDTSLTSVTIPNSLSNIGEGAFAGLTINAATNNPFFLSVAGVLFNEAQTTLIEFPPGISTTSYEVPDSVTGIGGFAFAGCGSLTNVTIPNSVTNIGEFAFDGCSLTNVTIGSSVTNIGDSAFFDCTTLYEVYFLGNAPAPAESFYGSAYVFLDDPAVAYYLPRTTGWSTTLYGIPTAPWTLPSPVILNGSMNFGVQPSGFSFTVSWASNATVIVEASTNLAAPEWQPLQTNTSAATNGAFNFSDPEWTNYPARFYRVVAQ